MVGKTKGKSTRGSPVDREKYSLYFIKDCDCGIINEHQLPESICEPSLTRLFAKCVEHLISANVSFSSERFAQVLARRIGNYHDIEIENQVQLRQWLAKLCEACRACQNFLNENDIKVCRHCDNEETPMEITEPPNGTTEIPSVQHDAVLTKAPATSSGVSDADQALQNLSTKFPSQALHQNVHPTTVTNAKLTEELIALNHLLRRKDQKDSILYRQYILEKEILEWKRDDMQLEIEQLHERIEQLEDELSNNIGDGESNTNEARQTNFRFQNYIGFHFFQVNSIAKSGT